MCDICGLIWQGKLAMKVNVYMGEIVQIKMATGRKM